MPPGCFLDAKAPPDSSKSLKVDKSRQKYTKSTRYMLQNSRGVFFLRSPKRRRQPPPDAQGLGILKPVKLVHLHVRTNCGDEIDIFSNTHTHIFHVAIRHLHAQAHITSVGSKSYNFTKCYIFFETFKCPYEHFPCVGSGHTAIYGPKSRF